MSKNVTYPPALNDFELDVLEKVKFQKIDFFNKIIAILRADTPLLLSSRLSKISEELDVIGVE